MLLYFFKHCKAKLYSYARLTGGGRWALAGSFRWISSCFMIKLQYWFCTTSPSTVSIIHCFQFTSYVNTELLSSSEYKEHFINPIQEIFTVHNTKEWLHFCELFFIEEAMRFLNCWLFHTKSVSKWAMLQDVKSAYIVCKHLRKKERSWIRLRRHADGTDRLK